MVILTFILNKPLHGKAVQTHSDEELTKELQHEKLIQELQGIIFCNPESYSENDRNRGWETADAYLSGNVREKLRIAKAHAKEQPELFGTNVEALEAVIVTVLKLSVFSNILYASIRFVP